LLYLDRAFGFGDAGGALTLPEDRRYLFPSHDDEAVARVAAFLVKYQITPSQNLEGMDLSAAMPRDELLSVIRAQDFFLGPLITALTADEIITEVKLPAWPARRRWGFQEFSRRRGDFALAGVALFYDEDDDGKAVNAHAGAIGVGDRPVRLSAVEAALNGHAVDAATIAAAAKAASAEVEPADDIHAPAAYRRALVGTLTERALKAAAAI
jgi:carbon-monoxide dehydrogenase medium subunit